MNAGSIIAVVIGVLTGIGGVITALVTRRKIKAESESLSISTMRAVVESVRQELERLKDINENLQLRLQEVEASNQQLRWRLTKLEEFLTESGHNVHDIYKTSGTDIHGTPI